MAWSKPTRRAALTGCLLVLTAAAMPGCTRGEKPGEPRMTAPFLFQGVTNVREVAQVTGPASPNRTDRFQIAGTDLGSMFKANGKTWFVFGDTFGQRAEGMTGGGGTQWRSNVLGYSTDVTPADGIVLDGFITDDTGAAKELIGSKKQDYDEMTCIPTYGFTANGAMYLAFMSVYHWGEPGEWETNHSGLARSTDNGQNWVVLDSPRWAGDSNFIQVSVQQIGSELFFWGVTHGRFGGVQLMKVPEAQVEDAKAYRYFTGTGSDNQPVWSADAAEAMTIVKSTVGELSVVHNKYLDRWIMTYTHGGGNGAEIRESATPWGPWGEAFQLVSPQAVPGLYSPYMHADFTSADGRTIYFTLSKWDPYNVYWFQADLIKGE